jgi:hypothetical protein
LYEALLPDRVRVLGAAHPDTLTTRLPRPPIPDAVRQAMCPPLDQPEASSTVNGDAPADPMAPPAAPPALAPNPQVRMVVLCLVLRPLCAVGGQLDTYWT